MSEKLATATQEIWQDFSDRLKQFILSPGAVVDVVLAVTVSRSRGKVVGGIAGGVGWADAYRRGHHLCRLGVVSLLAEIISKGRHCPPYLLTTNY